ncbi:DUF1631 domain-containing protein [Endozoicomonas gorgoniicola]|uniref:DUF1631 domain-containing protein n=1 Tax=Endozoicomonas gorgoniicola TaxID=1234144 RepID=A0ABT3MXV4_9GAMM|nr:DUF1631 domain-containing protein [Endozoicomonas gorgoniicola]MCW7554216.1 DUF1631 domain-containing protein [Endozoicomonas gorgoniicola]
MDIAGVFSRTLHGMMSRQDTDNRLNTIDTDQIMSFCQQDRNRDNASADAGGFSFGFLQSPGALKISRQKGKLCDSLRREPPVQALMAQTKDSGVDIDPVVIVDAISEHLQQQGTSDEETADLMVTMQRWPWASVYADTLAAVASDTDRDRDTDTDSATPAQNPPQSPAAEPSPEPSPEPAPDDTGSDTAENEEPTFEFRVAATGTPDTHSPATPEPAAPESMAEDIHAHRLNLSHQIAELAEHQPQGNTLRLSQMQEPIIELLSTHQETSADVDAEIVSMLSDGFDDLLDDPDFEPPLKAIFSRLQLPLLRVAVMEPEFLLNPDHSGRRLLSQLIDTSYGISARDLHRDQLYADMERIVKQFLTQFEESGVTAATEACVELERLGQEKEKRYISAAQTSLRQVECKIRVDLIKEGMLTDIRERVHGVSLSEAVEDLVFNGWGLYLRITNDRYGSDSKQMRIAWQYLDYVVQACSLLPDSDKRTATLSQLDKVTRGLRKGLTGIGFGQAVIDHWMTGLTSMIKDQSVRTASEPDTEVTPADPDLPAHLAGKYEIIDTLEPGCWFRFTRGESTLRGKLEKVMEHSQHYVFLDHNGGLLMNFSRRELAEAMVSGDAIKIEEIQVFEKSLRNILHDMKHIQREEGIV